MQKTARDMILSLGLIGLVSGVVWLFIPHDDSPPDLKRVGCRVDLLTARRAASYPVAAPEGLPEAWKPTSVRFRGDEGDAWHLGYQTPDGQYVAVEAVHPEAAGLHRGRDAGRREAIAQQIDGRTWTRFEGGHYDALVLRECRPARPAAAGTGSGVLIRLPVTNMPVPLRTDDRASARLQHATGPGCPPIRRAPSRQRRARPRRATTCSARAARTTRACSAPRRARPRSRRRPRRRTPAGSRSRPRRCRATGPAASGTPPRRPAAATAG
ncbi:hypothetical protein SGRIM128S_06211 [Streptomyces griseomycini]